MDTRLLVFAGLLIVIGAFVGYTVVLVFGLILLLPALLIPSRPPSQRKVEQKKEEPRNRTPAPLPTAPVSPAPSTPSALMATIDVPHAAMSAQPSASGALFPNAMFPTLSLMPQAPEPTGRPKHEVAETRDELLELVLLFVILKTLGS
jgi:hypothetical protein